MTARATNYFSPLIMCAAEPPGIKAARLGSSCARHEGFTLIELLVVMGIMVILLTLVVPASNSIFKASAITRATDVVAGQLTLARQQALTKNRKAEVRFYQYASGGGTICFCALQAFESLESGLFAPLDKVQVLPGLVVIDAGNPDPAKTLSSLVSLASASTIPTSSAGSALNFPVPGVGLQYNAVKFQFLPDGSTNLPLTSGPWFLTLHSLVDGDALAASPKNFATIQIDPHNGILHTIRP